MNDIDLKRRALATYYRLRYGNFDMPFTPEPQVVELDGKRYVVIYGNGIRREVYRVRNDGVLRRLRRWPKQWQ